MRAAIQPASNPAILRVTRSTQTWIQLFPLDPIDRSLRMTALSAAFIRLYQTIAPRRRRSHDRGFRRQAWALVPAG